MCLEVTGTFFLCYFHSSFSSSWTTNSDQKRRKMITFLSPSRWWFDELQFSSMFPGNRKRVKFMYINFTRSMLQRISVLQKEKKTAAISYSSTFKMQNIHNNLFVGYSIFVSILVLYHDTITIILCMLVFLNDLIYNNIYYVTMVNNVLPCHQAKFCVFK